IKADVAAGLVALVNLDRDDVFARHQQPAVQVGAVKAPVLNGVRGQGRVGDCATGHVAAIDLGAVEVNDSAVVAQDLERQAVDGRGISDGEGFAEIGGDELPGGVAAIADDGRFVAVPVTELRFAAFPRGVVKGEL